MVKVVKRGKPLYVGTYHCTGEGFPELGCRSTLKIYDRDLYLSGSRHHEGGKKTYYIAFMCPCCKTRRTIPTGNYTGNPANLPSKPPVRKTSNCSCAIM